MVRLFLCLVIFAGFVGCAGSGSLDEPQSRPPSPSDRQVPVVRVSDQFKRCKTNSQCARVAISCANCGCDDAVNKQYVGMHKTQLDRACFTYRGRRCETVCQKAVTRCVLGKCTLVKSLDGT